MTKIQRLWKKKAMRNWRERHPIMASWHTHKSNAKHRKIPILWDYDEFAAWCFETGYHILRKDGYSIHRDKDTGPYCSQNCVCVPNEINRKLQDFYLQRSRKRKV
jgi:hypothetical protein